MYDVGVAELLSGADIGDVKFARQLDSDFLPGNLPQRSIGIDGDAVLPDDSLKGNVILYDCQNLSVTEAVARNLRLRESLAVSRQNFNDRPYAHAGEYCGNERTVA